MYRVIHVNIVEGFCHVNSAITFVKTTQSQFAELRGTAVDAARDGWLGLGILAGKQMHAFSMSIIKINANAKFSWYIVNDTNKNILLFMNAKKLNQSHKLDIIKAKFFVLFYQNWN